MPLARLAVFVAAAGLLAGGCGSPASQAVAMVSGRDDHGLLERPAIGFQRSPSDPAVVGSTRDGAFVRVLREDRSWSLVRTLEPPVEEGWVNDHDLRAVVFWRERNVQVRLIDARVRDDGAVEVLVQPIGAGESERSWTSERGLSEVGAR